MSKKLMEGILAAAKENGHDATGGYTRGMFGFFFNKGPVNNFTDAAKSDGGEFIFMLRGVELYVFVSSYWVWQLSPPLCCDSRNLFARPVRLFGNFSAELYKCLGCHYYMRHLLYSLLSSPVPAHPIS